MNFLSKSLLVSVVLVSLGACASRPKQEVCPMGPNTSDEIAGQAYLDLLTDLSPEMATALGIHTNDTRLDDRSKEAEARAIARQEEMLRDLKNRASRADITPEGKIDLALMIGSLEVDIRTKRERKSLEREPDLYVSPLGALFLMTAREYAPAADRAKAVIARLEKIPAVVAQAKKNLTNPPRIYTEIGIERTASAKAFLEAQRPFLIKALPSEAARIDVALKAAEDAYDDYRKFLQTDVLPRSNGKFAAGREYFEFRLKNDYFLEENADQLLEMGKRVFAETDAQMTAVARKIDPKAKGWPDVVARLKGKHPTAEGLLEAYRTEVARARKFLVDHDVVAFPSDDDLEVVDTPPFMRSTISAAYDQPPPFDQVTKGFFFVTPVDLSLSKEKQEEMLRENDHGDLVDTAVHEAYPGHHLQLSVARRHPSHVRKALDHAIFSEGWALYSEELMAELGYYTDEERLMQLEWTLVRAARIVIDIGLHVGDMTFDQAVAMLTDQVHLEKELALSEVKRYTLTPTQPLAYLTGRQMIFKLRDRYKAREGAKFSLKAFHSAILSHGTIPPSLLAREMFRGG